MLINVELDFNAKVLGASWVGSSRWGYKSPNMGYHNFVPTVTLHPMGCPSRSSDGQGAGSVVSSEPGSGACCTGLTVYLGLRVCLGWLRGLGVLGFRATSVSS